MIYIDDQTPEPEVFRSEEFRRFRRDLWDFHLAGGSRKLQRRMDWLGELSHFGSEARAALEERFLGKCAYTEAPLFGWASSKQGEYGTITLYRPGGDALDLEGNVSPEHYWWLIPEWSNWRWTSESVSSVKGTQFPVQGDRTSPPLSPDDAPRSDDEGLLLDPLLDAPAWWLRFGEDGTVQPRSTSVTPRGALTIQILDLNNEHLVSQRRGVADRAVRPVSFLEVSLADLRSTLLDPQRPFSAVLRQIVARDLLDHVAAQRESPDPEVVRELARELAGEALGRYQVVPSHVREALWPVHEVLAAHHPEITSQFHYQRLRLGPTTLGDLSATGPEPTEVPPEETGVLPEEPVVVFSTPLLTRVVIENFKAVRHLTLDVVPTDPSLPEADRRATVTIPARWGTEDPDRLEAVRWKTLLGENGSGKSCILEAVGLALAGQHLDDIIREGDIEWRHLLRRPVPGESPPQKGSIRLTFQGLEHDIELRFNQKKAWYVGTAPEMQKKVRGYGATRLLDSGTHTPKERQANLLELRRSVRVANLYNPTASILDAEAWLCGLPEADFNAVSLFLVDLLSGAGTGRSGGLGGPSRHVPTVRRVPEAEPTKILVDGDPLKLVSDGYRSIIAIGCDIVAGMGEGYSDLREARGLVLIDELGAHLHPSWRMSITETLRRALPNVQFLVSTHEPLCLRGLYEGEVERVRKTPEEGVTVETIQDSPSRYRVDQLLTSEYFGLDTTIDPDLERRFRAYYQLLAVEESKRTKEQRQQLAVLAAYLQQHSSPALGHSRRDQLVYEAIDGFLMQQATMTDEQRKESRKKVLEEVRDLWEQRKAQAS